MRVIFFIISISFGDGQDKAECEMEYEVILQTEFLDWPLVLMSISCAIL